MKAPSFSRPAFHSYSVLATLVLGLFLVNACSKTNDTTTVTPTNGVSIGSIDPTTGTGGTVVTIVGTGFSTTLTDNKVKFNGVDATVQTATATRLTVVAPTTGQTGAISVQNGSQTTSGPTFTYTAAAANEPVVTTYAGTGVSGFVEGTAKTAQFDKPFNIAVDLTGNVYVTEYSGVGGARIRKIAPDGTVSTLAGSSTYGYKDGNGSAAQFRNASKMVCDAQGNIYVYDDSRIRKVTPTGDVTTVAGTGGCGSTDGPAASASFCGAGGMVLSPAGDLYLCDANNFRIRKISGGQVTTVAGGKMGSADGTGTAAQFTGSIAGITIDSKGNLYVGDTRTLRKITPQGVVTTFVGASTNAGNYTEGTGAAAVIGNFFGMVVDGSDNIYAADFGGLIWKITPAGVATIVTGGALGYKDGGRNALFNSPTDIGRDSQGNLYVTDMNNNVIRKIVLK